MKKIVSLALCAIMLICAFVVPTTAETVATPDTKTEVTKALNDVEVKDEEGKVVEVYKADDQGIRYTIDADNNAVVGLDLYAESNSSEYAGANNGIVVIPEYVTIGDAKYAVTKVGRNAFDTSAVKEVYIGKNVTVIGEMAFAGCESLEAVTMTSVKTISGLAFWHCCKLVDASINVGVETIGGAAFWSCASLTDVTLPKTVTSVGEKAFWNCTALKQVNNFGVALVATNFIDEKEGSAIPSTIKINTTVGAYTVAPTVIGSAGDKATARVLTQGNDGYNGTVNKAEITIAAGTVDVDGTSVSVVACEHSATKDITVVCATCDEVGSINVVCTACHAVVSTKEAAQLTHNIQSIITAPTCTDEGYTTEKCTLCRATEVKDTVEALGHDYTSVVSTVPTWDTVGACEDTCATCKRIDKMDIPMAGDVNGDGAHDFKDVSAVIKVLATWDVEVYNAKAAELTGDDTVDFKDVSRMLKKLANWDVEILGFGTVVETEETPAA